MTRLTALTAVLILLSGFAYGAATVTLVVTDPAGVGFNDPTPVAPLPTNPGTTLGEQRYYAIRTAADIWGATLDSSVEILIRVRFLPLACTANGAVLASAGTSSIVANFPGAAYPDTWYHLALADKLAGQDLTPGITDVTSQFNISLGGTNPDGTPCFVGPGWYYGTDANEPAGAVDIVATALHEFAHGLGFSSFVNKKQGTSPKNWTDVYTRNVEDNSTGLRYDGMNASQRRKSITNTGHVVWTGANVVASAPAVLGFTPFLFVNSPASIAGAYNIGTAAFGPTPGSPAVGGDLQLVNDGVPVETNGCEPLPAGSLAGKVGLVDRGTCTFVLKAQNLQAAGAVAMVLANNAPGAAPGMAGADPTIVIPVVSVSQDDGNLLKNALLSGTVNVTIGQDTSHLAGADANNKVRLFDPDPVVLGSSLSHWDTSTLPNQLMEPAINGNLTHNVTVPFDLTFELFKDLGW